MGKIVAKVFQSILTSVLISAVIYFGIAAVLILTSKPNKPDTDQRGLSFDEMPRDLSRLPKLQSFVARDGKRLAYRHYPADSGKIVILVHGTSGHSSYWLALGKLVSSEGLAQVYTPDLRGHGPSGLATKSRGDVSYIGQLEDDLADLITIIEKNNPEAMLILGGHSSGGGLVLRFAGSRYRQSADAYLLLAPYLKYNAPTTRPEAGGWVRAYDGRFAGLAMLNNVGITWFNYLTVLEFNKPEEIRSGIEVLSYTYRLSTSNNPRNYKKDLSAITQPLLVVVGTEDDCFYAEEYKPLISKYTEGQVKLLPGVSHMGVVVGPEVRPVIREWLEGLGQP